MLNHTLGSTIDYQKHGITYRYACSYIATCIHAYVITAFGKQILLNLNKQRRDYIIS